MSRDAKAALARVAVLERLLREVVAEDSGLAIVPKIVEALPPAYGVYTGVDYLRGSVGSLRHAEGYQKVSGSTTTQVRLLEPYDWSLILEEP